MRVVIIGGSGLIGRALRQELTGHGHQVTVLTRSTGSKEHPDFALAEWDGKDEKRLAELLDGQEAVVNLAGESIGKGRWSLQRKQTILSSRLEPGTALVAALNSLAKGPRVMVQASAIGYYGTGAETLDENSPAGADWLAEVCRQWEGRLSGLQRKEIRQVILRNGVVLVREGGVLAQLSLPVRLFVGGPLGNGKQWISWIHLTDEVRAIRFLLENAACAGVYNLTAPEPVNNRQMGQALARQLHRPFWLPLPAFALRMLLGEMSLLVLEGQRVLPKRLQQAGFEFAYPDVVTALKDLYR